jgi:branched-chain amino acid transport system ATP-binding protein
MAPLSRVDGKEAEQIVSKGIVLVPEGRQLFPYLSVETNLELGASIRTDKAAIRRSWEEVFDYFPRLKERLKQKAGTLSGGEQQMLAIGRGLMADPKLMCLDERSLGLAPILVEMIGKVIRNLNQRGVTVLLAEQNIRLALGVADRGYALQVGRVVLDGDIETMRSSDLIKKAYFGNSRPSFRQQRSLLVAVLDRVISKASGLTRAPAQPGVARLRVKQGARSYAKGNQE